MFLHTLWVSNAQEMGLGKVSFLEVRKESTRDTLTNIFLFEVPATLLTHQVSLTFPGMLNIWHPSGSPMSSSTATPCHFISHTLFLHFIYNFLHNEITFVDITNTEKVNFENKKKLT